MTTAVIDYGIGNVQSVVNACVRLGENAVRVSDGAALAELQPAKIILPGVGAIGAALARLRAHGFAAPLDELVRRRRVPFLGICVGMQMLFTSSEEDPEAAGLGVIPGRIRWIPPGVKRPQMQWNKISVRHRHDPLLAGLDNGAWVYFVHSLHGVPDDPAVVAATCEYGGTLNVAFRIGNVFGTQFHPEKSSRDGLRLLGNFVEACR
jgi:glutamine amidotransferase